VGITAYEYRASIVSYAISFVLSELALFPHSSGSLGCGADWSSSAYTDVMPTPVSICSGWSQTVLLSERSRWMFSFPQTRVTHIYLEGNQCADYMANAAREKATLAYEGTFPPMRHSV